MAKSIKEYITVSGIIKYIFGMVFIAVGVAFMLKAQLGNSSWDTLHYSMEQLFNITFGTATIIVAVTVLIIVVILNKSFKYVFMAIPIFIVGPLIDLFNIIVQRDIVPETLFLQFIVFIIGITLLPLGGAFLLISGFPGGVFDELNLAIVRKLKLKSLVPTRVIMELAAIFIAAVLGFLAGFRFDFNNLTFGNIGIGTPIFAITVGVYLKTYLKILERIGLYENKQTD